MERTINYTDKPLEQFTPEDTIYIVKMVGRHQHTYFCQFIKYERGIVHGKVISWHPEWALRSNEAGKIVTSRKKTCYLWGNDKAIPNYHDHCIWFK